MASEISEEEIRKLYNDPKKGLLGVKAFATKNDLNYAKVKDALKDENAVQFNRPSIRKYPTRKVIVRQGPNHQFQIDLADMSYCADENDGTNFLFCAIDCFSRKAYVYPMKSKNATDTAECLKRLLKETTFSLLQSDSGTEFKNKTVKAILDKHDIKLFQTTTATKASIVERFIRTLKGRLARLFDATGSFRYIDDLQDIVDNYNETIHSTLGIAPDDVNSDNEDELKKRMYTEGPRQHPKFKVGDFVRTQYEKATFQKESTYQRWMHELFKIKDVLKTNPPTYKLTDHNNTEIERIFYEPQLQLAKQPETFSVEKILKRRTRKGIKEVLVKWVGYPEKEATWEPASEIPEA